MNPRRRCRLRQQKKHRVFLAVSGTENDPVFRSFRLALRNIRRQIGQVEAPKSADDLFAGFE